MMSMYLVKLAFGAFIQFNQLQKASDSIQGRL